MLWDGCYSAIVSFDIRSRIQALLRLIALGLRSRLHTPVLRPAESGAGRGSRPIFAANPSVITDLVEDAERVREIDFAVIGFMPIRDAGDLHMRVGTREIANVNSKIAFSDLAVIEVELQLDVVAPNLVQNCRSLDGRIEEITRVVPLVEGLDQYRDAMCRDTVGGTPQIAHVDRCAFAPVRSRGPNSGHRVKLFATCCQREFESTIQSSHEFTLAPGQCGHAALAARPIARWQVEERLG